MGARCGGFGLASALAAAPARRQIGARSALARRWLGARSALAKCYRPWFHGLYGVVWLSLACVDAMGGRGQNI